MAPRPVRLNGVPCNAIVSAAGTAEATFTSRGDVWVGHVSVIVQSPSGGTLTNQSTATLLRDGQFFEGTYSGNSDVSDSRYLMLAGEALTAQWTGADPLARATMYVYGLQYPSGAGLDAA
ncbi:MAG TPA: hypothetical protein VK659_08415 [Asanoa sp.]|nr:hypothetical protein [Asanoa sp.]